MKKLLALAVLALLVSGHVFAIEVAKDGVGLLRYKIKGSATAAKMSAALDVLGDEVLLPLRSASFSTPRGPLGIDNYDDFKFAEDNFKKWVNGLTFQLMQLATLVRDGIDVATVEHAVYAGRVGREKSGPR